MTKRKLSEEANNLKLEDLMRRSISSEISESSDCVLFVRHQQDDEKSKTLENLWQEGKKATDKLLELLKPPIIDDVAVTIQPIGENSEIHTVDENQTQQ
ncbi:hypothetical protein Megpolyxen_01281 [Candidatus Megaera polyxenophila]|jgi:hypothetical protein|nr:hypothetical protein Megpolyxen_01281 [Candidatus Megaera polyxenophila]